MSKNNLHKISLYTIIASGVYFVVSLVLSSILLSLNEIMGAPVAFIASILFIGASFAPFVFLLALVVYFFSKPEKDVSTMTQNAVNNKIFVYENHRLNVWAGFISKWSAIGAIILIGIAMLIAFIEPEAMAIGIILSPFFLGLLFISGIFFCIQYYTEK